MNPSDLETYPEIEKFMLINLYTGDEILCTKQQIIDAFGEDECTKIYNNKHNYWQLLPLYN